VLCYNHCGALKSRTRIKCIAFDGGNISDGGIVVAVLLAVICDVGIIDVREDCQNGIVLYFIVLYL